MSQGGNIEVTVVDAANSERGNIALPAAFAVPVRDYLLFEEVLAQLASRRRGTASTKTRGEIRGGGKKPWKQKGTGRARAGSTRSPIWRGGGTTFGPRPRSYEYRLPRKARRAALCSALSQKARDGQVRVIEGLAFEQPKTKQMKELLSSLGISASVLIVLASRDRAVERSGRNLPGVLVTTAEGLNVYDILKHDTLLVTKDALAAIEQRTAV